MARDDHGRPGGAAARSVDDIEQQILDAPPGLPLDEVDRRAAGGPAQAVSTEGWLETTCAWLCCAALVVMMVMTSAEVFTRAVFNYSFQVTDELGGYLLVGITFLSMSVCQVRRSYHHIEFLQARLGPRGRAWSNLIFTAVCIAFVLVMAWQLVVFEGHAWHAGDVAPTSLATPLWIPQLAMPLGLVVLLYSLLKTARVDLLVLTGRLPPPPRMHERPQS